MLLLFTLVIGVLGMHALVLLPSRPDVGGQVAAPDAPFVVAAPGPGQAERADASPGTPTHPMPVPVHVAPPVNMAVPDGITAVPVGPGPDQPGHGADRSPGHGSMPSSLHQILHLCLAILAALLVLGAIALALWCTLRPDRHAIRISTLDGRAPRRRPPPTSVRLAQLCVLRN